MEAAASLDQAQADTKALIKDAHETMRSLRLLIKEAKAVIAELRDANDLFDEMVHEIPETLIADELARQLAELGPTVKKQMDRSVAKVISEFDNLRDIIMGGGKSGKPSLRSILDA